MKELFLNLPVLAAGSNVLDALYITAIGWLGIFMVTGVIIAVVYLLASLSNVGHKKASAPAPAAPVAAPAAPQEKGPVAPGSAGQLKLYDVEPKTAAMLMAIVAEKTGKPINELRFISIREVE